jgi:NAD(P)-dependent dehydrogenase (short-subunit alcohol dehydrogenase family)
MSDSKIAIVIGGSRWIGRNTILCLARRGVRSIFIYKSNRAEAGKVVALATDAGVRAIALSDDFGWVNAQRVEVAGGIHI